jgi:hypothetical protein
MSELLGKIYLFDNLTEKELEKIQISALRKRMPRTR